MSYSVEYKAEATRDDVLACSSIMFHYYPYPSRHFSWNRYVELAYENSVGYPSIVCKDKHGVVVGALAMSPVTSDPHIPGTGSIVYNTVVHPDHPMVTRLLYKFLVNWIREQGGQWYQNTIRLNEFEFKSKYRMI